MPKKGITKSRITITLDLDLVEILNKECKDRAFIYYKILEVLDN